MIMEMEKKIDEILKILTAQNVDIAVIKEQLKEIEKHDKLHNEHKAKIEDLEKNQYRAIGALGVLGLLITFLGNWLAKKL